ncbi:MAG: tetratricopeptide repeat protein [Candidatus Thorarchaeota archaeon]
MSADSNNQLAIAINHIETGSYTKAVEILEAFLKEKPDSLEGWYNLGFALMQLDKDEDAIKAFDEGLAIDNMIFELWFNKGTALYHLADFKGAIECYEKALELQPEDAEAWNNLGNCYSRLAEGKEAIKAYTRAVALKPDYAEAFYNKANAHFIEGDDEHAITYAELAIELDSALIDRVSQWIEVSRGRLAAVKAEIKYEQKMKDLKSFVDKNE